MIKTKDPVCGMTVDRDKVKGLTSDFDGQNFYFCSRECQQKFDANPHQFAPQIRWPEDWEAMATDPPTTL